LFDRTRVEFTVPARKAAQINRPKTLAFGKHKTAGTTKSGNCKTTENSELANCC
jgi:hypothetical protein